MHTGQLHYYPKCKIRNVAYADKMEYLSFDVESESGAHLNTISVCNRTVKDDIRKLLSHPTIRLFWAYGMVDVDIWKKNSGVYVIEWSPYDGFACEYEVSEEELKKLLQGN